MNSYEAINDCNERAVLSVWNHIIQIFGHIDLRLTVHIRTKIGQMFQCDTISLKYYSLLISPGQFTRTNLL